MASANFSTAQAVSAMQESVLESSPKNKVTRKVKSYSISARRSTPEYRAWQDMLKRAARHRSASLDDRNYRDRGISVCDRWLIYENFLSDMGARPDGHYSLDRIDNDGDYCPENCRWATIKEQQRNRRTNRTIVVNGVRMCLIEAVEKYNLSYDLVRQRLCRGWSVNEALTRPLIFSKSNAAINGWKKRKGNHDATE